MAARDAKRHPGGDDTRARNFTIHDRIAQGDVGIPGRPDISHRGEPGLQRRLGIGHTRNRRARQRYGEAAIAVIVMPAGQVDMAVGQSGQDVGALHVDHRLRAVEAERILTAKGDDPAILDQDGIAGHHIAGPDIDDVPA